MQNITGDFLQEDSYKSYVNQITEKYDPSVNKSAWMACNLSHGFCSAGKGHSTSHTCISSVLNRLKSQATPGYAIAQAPPCFTTVFVLNHLRLSVYLFLPIA